MIMKNTVGIATKSKRYVCLCVCLFVCVFVCLSVFSQNFKV